MNELWRLKLAEAQRLYSENRTRDSRLELGRTLAIFTALVMRGIAPPDEEPACNQ